MNLVETFELEKEAMNMLGRAMVAPVIGYPLSAYMAQKNRAEYGEGGDPGFVSKTIAEHPLLTSLAIFGGLEGGASLLAKAKEPAAQTAVSGVKNNAEKIIAK